MKTEVSAGGIVVRNIGTVWYVLVLRDMNNNLTFPKGKVEGNESPVKAAKREIREEVGLAKIESVIKLPVIHYVYQRDGVISKTVYYFLFTSLGKEKLVPQTEEGIHDAAWVPIDEALEYIGYSKTNGPLLKKVKLWTLNQHRT